ncbi:MAG TPA: cysteine desulfurase family protein [Gemmatimonadales bacterium]|nr:cysteine desulfurase family protein [Gemmatimonadales bacterium]
MPAPVYLDHAATTPVRSEVLEAMMPYLTDQTFGNPSSAHRFGRAARAGIEQARRQIAEALGAEPSQVIFTSGGTEADNLSIVGAVLAARDRGAPMCAAVSAIEHKAVIAAAHAVCHLGGREILLSVDRQGLVELDALDEALADKPAIVSVMWVNNEVGTVQPVGDIAARCQDAGVVFHTDAVQAVGKVPVVVKELRCTLLTLSGHKIGAPKGIGALIVRDRKAIEAILHGGGQQFGIRPGTENVAGAVALGRAVQLAVSEQPATAERLAKLRNHLVSRLKAVVPDIAINAHASPRAPHLLSVAIAGADSEALLMHFDLAGVAVSSGSACSTGAVEPSHVLVAMGVPRELALGTIRFSLGRDTSAADIERAIEVVPGVVEKVRRLAGVLGRTAS